MADPAADPFAPWDSGLQNERTGLAWQRTLLSGLACGLLVARLLATVWLPAALVVGVLALGGTAAVGGLAVHRFRTNSVALQRGRLLADGRAPALVTALVATTALAATAFVLLG